VDQKSSPKPRPIWPISQTLTLAVLCKWRTNPCAFCIPPPAASHIRFFLLPPSRSDRAGGGQAAAGFPPLQLASPLAYLPCSSLSQATPPSSFSCGLWLPPASATGYCCHRALLRCLLPLPARRLLPCSPARPRIGRWLAPPPRASRSGRPHAPGCRAGSRLAAGRAGAGPAPGRSGAWPRAASAVVPRATAGCSLHWPPLRSAPPPQTALWSDVLSPSSPTPSPRPGAVASAPCRCRSSSSGHHPAPRRPAPDAIASGVTGV